MLPFSSPYDENAQAQQNPIQIIDWGHANKTHDATPHGIAAAIGNFDGLHIGHTKVITDAVSCAQSENITPAVITFNPHPRRFFNPDAEGFAILDEDDKIHFLARLGVKCVIRLTFDDAMRQTSAQDFVSQILANLKVKHLFAGRDFTFGKDRAGSMEMIAQIGANQGLVAYPTQLQNNPSQNNPPQNNKAEAVSSTRIRGLISQGDMAGAAQLLGRPHIISGQIIIGDQRGRTIGFPTANMRIAPLQKPAFGVYAVAIRLADQGGKILAGVANIGVRPTAPDRGVLLEANIFDYDGDLYGQRVNVFLLDFIRPERSFDDFDALKEQIAKDANTARQFHRDCSEILL